MSWGSAAYKDSECMNKDPYNNIIIILSVKTLSKKIEKIKNQTEVKLNCTRLFELLPAIQLALLMRLLCYMPHVLHNLCAVWSSETSSRAKPSVVLCCAVVVVGDSTRLLGDVMRYKNMIFV